MQILCYFVSSRDNYLILYIGRFNENTAINNDHINFNTQSLSNNMQNNY